MKKRDNIINHNQQKPILDQFIKQLHSRLDVKLNKLRKELDNYYIVCDDKEKEQTKEK